MNSEHKKLFIGADEAGYGPNLGPLVISASSWEVDTSLSEQELCTQMLAIFRPETWKKECLHIPLGDSKQLYQRSSGIRTLEAGLLAMLGQTREAQANLESGPDGLSLQNLLDHVAAPGHPSLQTAPWYEGLDHRRLPIEQTPAEIERLTEVAKTELEQLGLQLRSLRARVVTEQEFNQLVERYGSKGLVLSQLTLALVGDLLKEHNLASEIFCDRQGGRKNYLPLLADAFPDAWFQETCISNERCSYRCLDRDLEIHFSVGGDRFPPTALASMLAKYLRETLMAALNDYWQDLLPSLSPTAGYPQDARRFRADIAETARRRNLDEHIWWRCK